MKTAIYFKLIMVCALCAIGLKNDTIAQTIERPELIILQEDEIQDIRQNYKLKIEELQQYLTDIVNTSLTNSQRRESIYAALELFVGKGKSYYIKDELGEIEYRNPVRVNISNTDNSKKKWMLLTKFLTEVYENTNRYGRMELSLPSIHSIDNRLIKVDENLYRGTATVCQTQTFYKDGRETYKDSTEKKIDLFLSPFETPGGRVWFIKLGDIQLSSTRNDI